MALALASAICSLSAPRHVNAEPTPITYGQTLTGTLGENEQDSYSFTAPVDGDVWIRVVSVSGFQGTSAVLYRVGQGNESVAGNDGLSVTMEQSRVHAGVSYEIRVPGAATEAGFPGQTYKVTLESVTTPAVATPIAVGGTRAGSIDQVGEMDFFTFTAHDGDALRFTVQRTSGAVDPSAVVYIPNYGTCSASDGQTLDPSNNPTVLTPCSAFSATQTYVVGVEDVDDAATNGVVDSIETGGYSLSIECLSGPCVAEITTTTTSTSTTIVTASTAPATTTTTLPPTVDQLVSGSKLQLRDAPGKAQRRALALRSTDAALTLGGGNGSADDPRTGGATLRVRSVAGAFDTTYPLPASGWKRIGKEGAGKGYRYVDRKLVSGPLASLTLKPKLLVVSGRGAGLQQTLTANPDPVSVALTVGGARYCLSFGGTVKYVAGKKLSAANANAPTLCP